MSRPTTTGPSLPSPQSRGPSVLVGGGSPVVPWVDFHTMVRTMDTPRDLSDAKRSSFDSGPTSVVTGFQWTRTVFGGGGYTGARRGPGRVSGPGHRSDPSLPTSGRDHTSSHYPSGKGAPDHSSPVARVSPETFVGRDETAGRS